MRSTPLRPLIAGVIIFLGSSITQAQKQPDFSKPKETVIPFVEKGPLIDGHLNDKCWQKASQLTNFLSLDRLKKTVTEQTVVWLLRDTDNLYFGFKCFSHNPEAIVAKRSGRDAYKAYKDDVVEIFLDTNLSKNSYYHWILNSTGAVWDAKVERLPYTARWVDYKQWNSHTLAKGSKDKEAWYLEVQIPMKDLGEKAREIIRNGGKWGLQIGREDWSAPGGKTEFSTWSRTYKFGEARDFGLVSFSGQAVKETIVRWEQKGDQDVVVTGPPERHIYDFVRVFNFGPAGDKQQVRKMLKYATDPTYAKSIYVDPSCKYSREKGYGFTKLENPEALANKGKGGYGASEYSPLVRQFIGSRKQSEFSFYLPRGRYRAVFYSGAHQSTRWAPVETEIEINGSRIVIENPMPARIFVSKKLRFTSDAKNPVKIRFRTKTMWLINFFAVYPEEDERKAELALDSLERDFFDYPVEEKIYKKANIWLEYPPKPQSYITEEERKQGFAVVNLPSAHFTPRNYLPQEEDSRDVMRAITSAGERTTIQFAFHALKRFDNLKVKIAKRPTEGIKLKLMYQRYTLRPIGRASLNQWGYEPRTLWPVPEEPVSIDSGRTRSYWLIIDVDDEVGAGVYPGRIDFYNNSRKIASREFRITVLPFRPRNRRFTWAMYYTPSLIVPNWSKFTEREKEIRFRLEKTFLKDLKRHGIDALNAVIFRGDIVKEEDGKWHFRPDEREKRWDKMRKEIGIGLLAANLENAYDAGGFILNEELKKNGYKPIYRRPNRYKCEGKLSKSFFDNLSLVVKEYLDYYKSLGMGSPPAFDIWDEPGSVNFPALAPFLDAVRKGGGKTYVIPPPGGIANPRFYGKIDLRMGLTGDDGRVPTTPEEVLKRKQRDGFRQFTYDNPAIMSGDPRVARFDFGYRAWAWGLDGLCPWKYLKIKGYPLIMQSEGANFQPLLPDGPDRLYTTTSSWEMFAEGIYDNKLVQLLEDLAQTGNGSAAASSAKEFLGTLRREVVNSSKYQGSTISPLTGLPIVNKPIWPACRYDYLRAQLVKRIMELSGQSKHYKDILKEVDEVEKEALRREKLQTARRIGHLPPVREGNLLANGGFEEEIKFVKGKPDGFSRWDKNAKIQSEVVHSGKRALEMTGATDKHHPVVSFKAVRLVTGRTYVFKGWAKREAQEGGVSKFSGFWLHTWDKQKKKFIRRIPLWFPPSKPAFDWKKFELTFIAEPEEYWIEPWIYYSDPKSVIYVDDVELRELDK